jgi:hypothetical protein
MFCTYCVRVTTRCGDRKNNVCMICVLISVFILKSTYMLVQPTR